MQKLLQEEGFALKDSFKITFCNSGSSIGESYAAFSAVISPGDYALTERALKYKFRFATFPTKESAHNYILFDSRLTENEIITSQFRNNYYVRILRQNSYTNIFLEDDSTLYISYENP